MEENMLIIQLLLDCYSQISKCCLVSDVSR